MRYRIKNDKTKDGKVVFPTPEAIHAELLKRLKVPAHVPKSGDPIQDEPFMDGLGIDWEKEKQTKPWLSNIGFQLQHVAHLEKEILAELAYLHKVNSQHVLVGGLARIFHRSRAINEDGIALVCPKIQVSNLDQRAGNAEAKLYRRN